MLSTAQSFVLLIVKVFFTSELLDCRILRRLRLGCLGGSGRARKSISRTRRCVQPTVGSKYYFTQMPLKPYSFAKSNLAAHGGRTSFDVISRNLMHPKSRTSLTAMGAAVSLAVAVPACDRNDATSATNEQTEAVAPESRSIHDAVEKIVAEILGTNAPKITPDSRFIEDLGADSLDAVEIAMALEEEFDLMITDEAAEKMTKVSDVTEYITRVLAQQTDKR